MKLWILRPIEPAIPIEGRDPWEPLYETARGFVVRAETEIEARRIANTNAGVESHRVKDPWLDSAYSTCVVLSADGDAEMVMIDFYGS